MLKRKINQHNWHSWNQNGISRDDWIKNKLSNLQKGSLILDAGAERKV